MNEGGKRKLNANGQLPEDGCHIASDLKELQVYNRIKLALADILRNDLLGFRSLGRSDAEKQCSDLMVKLAEDRFTLAVVGQFKRGKSSLMNAIVGEDIIPTGILPLTSLITKLKYGSVKKMLVNYEYSVFAEDKPVSLLRDYVTEERNPHNVKRVNDVILELPVPLLQKGVEFVDTPGIGSAIESNTEITYDFLPNCDAVIFVTAVDAPMSTLEIAFLKKIVSYVDKIFFVVNKADLLAEYERDDIVQFAAKIIRSQTGQEHARVFLVSSHEGFTSKMIPDSGLYAHSGLKSLEGALVTFLTREKTSLLLKTSMGKLLEIFDNEYRHNAFGTSYIESRTIDEGRTDVVERNTAIALLIDTQNRVSKLYNDVLEAERAGSQFDKVKLSGELPSLSDGIINKSDRAEFSQSDAGKLEMTDIEETGSCPVCRHLVIQLQEFYAHWQYLLATDERSEVEFGETLGFCSLHTWQLLAVSSPYGASLGYTRLADKMADRLRSSISVIDSGNKVTSFLKESEKCKVCSLLRDAEKVYVGRFSELIDTPDGRRLYSRSDGLCRRHLSMLCDSSISPGIQKFLLLDAARHFEQDAEDMKSYAMKRDALRRSLLNQSEKTAYFRTITRIVGYRSLCVPWDQDGEI